MRPSSGRTRGLDLARCAVVTFVLLLAPRVASACPVCFGENDSPLALGINYGIFVMLGLIVGLWAAFASFFIYLRRRARMVEGALDGPTTGAQRYQPVETGLQVPRAQGGTV